MITATSTGIIGAEAAKVLQELADPSRAASFLPFVAATDPLNPTCAVWHLSTEFVALIRERSLGATAAVEEVGRLVWKGVGGQCSVEGTWTVIPAGEREARVTLVITWRIREILRPAVEAPLR